MIVDLSTAARGACRAAASRGSPASCATVAGVTAPLAPAGAGRRIPAAPALSGGAADASGGGAGTGGATRQAPRPPAFEVRLENFEGPFDLLLSLISRRQLDVTEVALSQVTDEFIGHIRALGRSWDLGQATEFLVVAATLLDLKAAKLLPAAEVENEEDLALLEARDLLFARLLQYRAYKEVAAHLSTLERTQARRFTRVAPLEPRFAELMPEVLLAVTPGQLAQIAAAALAPKPPPRVPIDHVHTQRVSVREQAVILRDRLFRSGRATFRGLTHDCQHTLELVARFLALLELYREGSVAFDQVAPLGELHVRWTGTTEATAPAEESDADEEYT
jgi:segregation and condensation protein A